MDLKRLLAPDSIAVVGASERPSLGRTVLRSLEALAYRGAVYPVHPRRATVLGRRCYATLDEVPGPIDLAALALARERTMAEVERAARRGVGALVVFSGGFAEAGDEGRRQQERMAALCREAGIALCGPNCMGVLNLHHGSHAYMLDVLDAAPLRGDVGLISQSGSISIGLLSDSRRFGFSQAISTGNEAAIGSARYLDHLVDDPATRSIALFSEAIAEPERFVAALDRAAAAGKPVVALKAGRTARTAAAIRTHTGGLAGSARVFSAVLRAHGAIEVDDLEEMTEVLAALQGAHLPAGERLAVVTGSGGHAGLLLDLAERAGLCLPPLPAAARRAIEAATGPLTGDGNPADAWGQGDFAANFTVALDEAAASGAYDAAVLALDAQDGQAVEYEGQDDAVTALLARAQSRHRLPFYLLSARHGTLKTAQAAALRRAGVATLTGMAQGLGAVARIARWQRRPGPPAAPASAPPAAPAWAARETVHEHDAKGLLAAAGLRVAAGRPVESAEEARRAGHEIGWPVVMKAVGDAIPHRSELGLVELGLADGPAAAAAWRRLRARLAGLGRAADGAAIVVQETAPPGVEAIAGIARDDDFGLVLALGPGGVLAELVDEAAMACLPLREGELERLTGGGRLARLLAGFRGRPPADTEALKQALAALAAFAIAHEPWIEGIDVNPLVVLPEGQGVVAADALIVPRRFDRPPGAA